ncbi:helix-turn-helix transcriptional regulator [Bradyrhizobium sp. Tv2a-2]|uniref:helix-turn-helix transcriptional regulator n=1 Tax=Bradyrhizobium sp. Tv2a-2 TaxID=113395 RepID=UPI0004679FBE|nr:helix-turn-helix transcriptional regulator [Bradyrhizobium sp. Tv2a-2]
MATSTVQTKAATSQAGIILRQWRGSRGKTQLDLSFDSGISQKHISFVESGRSMPSRQTLLDLAQALQIPLREQNTLLLAAGYAPVYSQDPLDAPAMTSITRALQRMLRQHEPFPAIVMDRHWNVLMTNDASPRFFNCFIDMNARPQPRNLLHLMFDPRGMRPFIANWRIAAKSLLARVHREALGGVIDPGTRSLLDELAKYPDVAPEWRNPTPDAGVPVIPLSFRKGAVTLNYFSMITTVGTPQTVATEELRLESMFPADEQTEEAHSRFVRDNADTGSVPKPN